MSLTLHKNIFKQIICLIISILLSNSCNSKNNNNKEKPKTITHNNNENVNGINTNLFEEKKSGNNDINDPKSTGDGSKSMTGSNEVLKGKYVMTNINGNFIYSIDKNLAATAFRNNLYSGNNVKPVDPTNEMNEDNKKIFHQMFNQTEITENDISKKANISFSGPGGQENALEFIQKAKNKLGADFNLITPNDFNAPYVILSCLLVKLKFIKKFSKKNRKFEGKKVKGFGLSTYQQLINIDLIEYVNKDKFIIELNTQDTNEQIICAKGYNDINPSEIINQSNNPIVEKNVETHIKDFWMPEINLEMQNSYPGISKHIPLKTNMKTITKFLINNEGAEIKSVTKMGCCMAAAPPPKEKKKIYVDLIFDKPYVLIFKNRKKENNAYFVLYVNNVELLKVVK